MSDLARQYKPMFREESKKLINTNKEFLKKKIKNLNVFRGFKLKFKQKAEYLEGNSTAILNDITVFKGRLLSLVSLFMEGEGETIALSNYGNTFKGMAVALHSNMFDKVDGSVYGFFNVSKKGKGTMNSIYANLVKDYKGLLFSLTLNKVLGELKGASISPFLYYNSLDGEAYAIIAVRCVSRYTEENARIKALLHIIVKKGSNKRQILKIKALTF